MNFISHFYYDRHTSDAYYVAGILIPDLWRGFSKHYNKHLRHSELSKLNPVELSIEKGILRHYEMDALFHNSPVFFEYTRWLEQDIKDNFQNKQERLFFVAHIAFELLLDRYLLKRDFQLGEKYFDLLQNVNETELLNYFNVKNFSADSDSFIRKFNRLVQHRYLLLLVNDSDFVFALGRIYEMATGKQLKPEFEAFVLSRVDLWDRRIENEPTDILLQIKPAE